MNMHELSNYPIHHFWKLLHSFFFSMLFSQGVVKGSPYEVGLFNGFFNCVRRIPVQLGTALDYPLVKVW